METERQRDGDSAESGRIIREAGWVEVVIFRVLM